MVRRLLLLWLLPLLLLWLLPLVLQLLNELLDVLVQRRRVLAVTALLVTLLVVLPLLDVGCSILTTSGLAVACELESLRWLLLRLDNLVALGLSAIVAHIVSVADVLFAIAGAAIAIGKCRAGGI